MVVEPVHRRLGLQPAQTADVFGARVELDLDEYVQRRIYYMSHEVTEARWMRRFLRSGDRVLDVGANVGYFSVLAASRLGAAGQIVAVEPIPANAAVLRKNTGSLSTPVEVVPAAVGEKSGTLELGLPFEIENSASGASGHFSLGGNHGTVTVDVRTVDELHDEFPPFRLVKVDVEGMEPSVIAGMTRTLANTPPEAILLEINPRALAASGRTPQDILGPLHAAGYATHRITALGRTGRAVTADHFKPVDASKAQAPGRLAQIGRALRGDDQLETVVALRPIG